jgi:hypothetical protein
MKSLWKPALAALIAAGLTACAGDGSDDADMPAADSTAAAPAAPAGYEPVASVLDLMRSMVTLPAEVYWESVMIVYDTDGETIHQPEDDLEWQEVWSAAITVAEAGNLLKMPRVGYPDDPEWNRFAEQLRDAGVQAAQVASRKDYMGVLDAGNLIYDACTACHESFMPTLSL